MGEKGGGRMRRRLMDLAIRIASAEPRIERQELWCHDCERYVQFDMDLSLNGNHVLECPNCGHEHCRVVENGKITDIRWAQRNGPTYSAWGNATFTVISSSTTTTSTSLFLAESWSNTTSVW